MRVIRSALQSALLAILLGSIAASTVHAQKRETPAREYRDAEYGFSLSLPAGWKWVGPYRWGDQETNVIFREPGTAQEVKLYVKALKDPEIIPAETMNKKLFKAAEAKARQRIQEGSKDFKNREDSFELGTIGGRSALSWAADFTQDGRHMVEYFTRVRSENTNALFFVIVPPKQLESLKQRLDPIMETLQIP